MRHAFQAALALLALSALPAAAAAQTVPSPFRYIEPSQSASLFAGYLETDTGDYGIGFQSGPIVGAHYAIRFSGPLTGEVMLATLPTQRAVVQRIAVGDSSELRVLDEGVDALVLTGEAGLRFGLTGARTWNDLAPYLSARGGVIGDLLGRTELEESIEASQRVDFGPSFAVSVGAGADWFPTERISVRLDARDHLWRISIPQGLTPANRQDSEWTHNLGVTLGVALHF